VSIDVHDPFLWKGESQVRVDTLSLPRRPLLSCPCKVTSLSMIGISPIMS
jgi:hypothetical protein